MLSAKREHWGSSFGFIMAAAGSAIGLGNIWRFPYITGMNGGGAFVLVYLGCILVIGLPVMLAELAIGRASQSDAIGAFRHFSTRSAVLPKVLGGFGIGLAVAVFVGWIWGTRKAARELYRRGAPPPDENRVWRFFHLQLPVTFWGFFIRFIAPVLVLIVFLSAAGFFNLNK